MTTAWKLALGATVATVMSATSCVEDSSSDGDDGNDDGSGDNGDDGGELDCTPNNSDGMTQCTNELGLSSQYCDPFGGTCANGCESTLNCALGDYCDKRMPTESFDGSLEIGICRTPGAECGASDDNASDENASAAGETTAVADETGSTEECRTTTRSRSMPTHPTSATMCSVAPRCAR